MRITIITVVLNGNKYIEDAIKSVLSQTYSDIEYIIIDGGSTDGTQKIVSKYNKNISIFVSEPDKGIYDAMNKGIGLSSGEVIGFLNSDDIYADPEVIADIANGFKDNETDGCYGDLIYVNSSLLKTVRYWKSGNYKKGAFRKGWMIPHPALFLHREVYVKYGVYHSEFKISADYELMVRVIEKYEISVYYIHKVFVKMRTGGRSNVGIRNLIIKSYEDMKAWKTNGLKIPLLLFLRKPAVKIAQFFKR